MTPHSSIRGRRFARYPSDGAPLVIRSDSEQFDAVALDESIGGLGIETKSPVSLVAGELVDVLYRDVEARARILAVKPNGDGACRISIGWLDKETGEESDQHCLFLRYGEVSVVCRSHRDADHQKKIITLWDGKEFVVEAKQLASRSREVRSAELHTISGNRDLIARLYGLDTSGSPAEVTARVVDFEFEG